jgi:hypothetical protein
VTRLQPDQGSSRALSNSGAVDQLDAMLTTNVTTLLKDRGG